MPKRNQSTEAQTTEAQSDSIPARLQRRATARTQLCALFDDQIETASKAQNQRACAVAPSCVTISRAAIAESADRLEAAA